MNKIRNWLIKLLIGKGVKGEETFYSLIVVDNAVLERYPDMWEVEKRKALNALIKGMDEKGFVKCESSLIKHDGLTDVEQRLLSITVVK